MQRLALCNDGDIRNVARVSDAALRGFYSRDMTDRTRREHTMKRIATIGAVITAFAIAPSIASAGNVAQVKPQLKAQVVGAQVAKAQRAQAAVVVQRHRVQIAQAQRWTILRAQLR